MAVDFLPAWPLDVPPLLWFALTLVAAGALGEFFFERLRLPRISGYVLAGLTAGAFGGGDIVRASLDSPTGWAGIAAELALGVLLFELGNRVNLGWLRANPWLLATSLLEAFLTFVAVYVLLRVAQVPFDEALLVATISMATAPAIVMRVVVETRAHGQVSDRLLVLTALNCIYTVLAAQLVMGWLHQSYRTDTVAAVLHPLYLIAGAVLAGAALAFTLRTLRSRLLLDDEHAAAVLIGLVLAVVVVLKVFKLPVLLALLLAGLLIRNSSGRPYVWPRGLNAVTGLLVVTLFVLTGVSVQFEHALTGGLIALALIAVRTLAKMAGVLIFARPSGVSWRQGAALGAALTPMSGIAFVLTYDLTAVFPELAPRLAATVLAATALLEVFSPIVLRWLLDWSDETPQELRRSAWRSSSRPATQTGVTNSSTSTASAADATTTTTSSTTPSSVRESAQES